MVLLSNSTKYHAHSTSHGVVTLKNRAKGTAEVDSVSTQQSTTEVELAKPISDEWEEAKITMTATAMVILKAQLQARPI